MSEEETEITTVTISLREKSAPDTPLATFESRSVPRMGEEIQIKWDGRSLALVGRVVDVSWVYDIDYGMQEVIVVLHVY